MNALVLILLAASAPPCVASNHEAASSVGHATTLDDLSCHWRQTGGCSKSGAREPKNDKPCSSRIAAGASGFCDCDGNGVMDGSEPGYDCKDSSPKTCSDACQAAAPAPTPEPTSPPTPEATSEATPEQEKVASAPTPPPTIPSNPASAYKDNFDKFNVMSTFKEAVQHELNNSKYPTVIAVIALVLGFILLFNGEKAFNGAVTFATAVVFGIIAKQAALSYWQEHDTKAVSSSNTVANLVGLEVGLVIAVAAHFGNKGMLVAIGAGGGFFVAHFLSDFFVANLHFESMLRVEFQVVWYSLICLAASVAVYKDKHLGLMAFVSPVPGGAFTASAVLYFATEAFVGFSCKHDHAGNMWSSDSTTSCPYGLTPKTAQWINFFTLAFDKTRAKSLNKDVGIFYNNTWNFMSGSWTEGHQTEGYMILVDHVISVVLWIVLTLIGIKVQRAAIRKQSGKTNTKKLNQSLLGA